MLACGRVRDVVHHLPRDRHRTQAQLYRVCSGGSWIPRLTGLHDGARLLGWRGPGRRVLVLLEGEHLRVPIRALNILAGNGRRCVGIMEAGMHAGRALSKATRATAVERIAGSVFEAPRCSFPLSRNSALAKRC